MRIGSSSMYSGWRYARIETALCSLLIPKRHISTTDAKTMSLLPCLLFPLYSSPPSFCHIFCILSSNIFPSSSRLLLCPHAGSCARDCDTQNVNLNWHRAVWHALTQLSKMKKKKNNDPFLTLFFSHPFPSQAAFSVFAASNLTCNSLQSSDNDFSTCSPISCSSSPSPVVALLLVLFTVSIHADYSQGDLSASDLPSIFLSACYFSLLCHPSAPIHPGYVCMGQFLNAASTNPHF